MRELLKLLSSFVRLRPLCLDVHAGRRPDLHSVRSAASPIRRGGALRDDTLVHYAALGRIPPKGNYRRTFECYAMPARERCFEFSVLIAAMGSEWALHGRLYEAGIRFVFAKIVDALKNIWVKPGEAVKVTEILADVMKEQARLSAEVQMVLANGIVQGNNKLAELHSR
jgi:hypothetical protein